MSWWRLLFRKRPQLEPTQQASLKRYHRLPQADLKRPSRAIRFVVVDVETTGLRLDRDRLIAIGAMPVEEDLVRLDACFEVVLRQAKPSAHDNILVHGIDGSTQTSGRDPAEALIDFLQYARKDLLVGFHTDFDRIMINRAAREALGIELENRWLDLAFVAPELLQEQSPGASTLDDWTERLEIENPMRHNAVADALVTAQLLQVVLAAGRQRGLRHCEELIDIERAGRWLRTHR